MAFLQHIMHSMLVARKVMEETPHVMLVVENMRRGDDPETACIKALEHIVSKNEWVK